MSKTILQTNLNDYVYFELTKLGEETLAEYYKTNQVKADKRSIYTIMREAIAEVHGIEGTFYKLQHWEFARIFGQHFFNGMTQMIKNNALYYEHST